MDIYLILSAFAALLAIIDPMAVVPLYVSLTDRHTEDEKKSIRKKAIIVATIILIIFGMTGYYIFMLFGFTINAFKIAGGILLFSLAFSMLHGERSRLTQEGQEDAADRTEIGVVPLGMPLIAGPGAITTIMIYMTNTSLPLDDKIGIFASMFVVIGITYVSLIYSDKIFKKIGKVGTKAITRIMGLILAAISIQFIIDGVFGTARLHGVI